MAEIVNLNRVKKRLTRARDAEQARENRIRFGRTAVQKQHDDRAEQARAASLDGKRREDADSKP